MQSMKLPQDIVETLRKCFTLRDETSSTPNTEATVSLSQTLHTSIRRPREDEKLILRSGTRTENPLIVAVVSF